MHCEKSALRSYDRSCLTTLFGDQYIKATLGVPVSLLAAHANPLQFALQQVVESVVRHVGLRISSITSDSKSATKVQGLYLGRRESSYDISSNLKPSLPIVAFACAILLFVASRRRHVKNASQTRGIPAPRTCRTSR